MGGKSSREEENKPLEYYRSPKSDSTAYVTIDFFGPLDQALQGEIEKIKSHTSKHKDSLYLPILNIVNAPSLQIRVAGYHESVLDYCLKTPSNQRNVNANQFLLEWGMLCSSHDCELFQYDLPTFLQSLVLTQDRFIRSAPYLVEKFQKRRQKQDPEHMIISVFYLLTFDFRSNHMEDLVEELKPMIDLYSKDQKMHLNYFIKNESIQIQGNSIQLSRDFRYVNDFCFINGTLQTPMTQVQLWFHQKLSEQQLQLASKLHTTQNPQPICRRVFNSFHFFSTHILVIESDHAVQYLHEEVENRKTVEIQDVLDKFLKIVKLVQTGCASVPELTTHIPAFVKLKEQYKLDLAAFHLPKELLGYYQPPEAVDGRVDYSTVQYAWVLGHILYELLTGQRLISGNPKEVKDELTKFDFLKYVKKISQSKIQFSESFLPKELQYLLKSLLRPMECGRLSLDALLKRIKKVNFGTIESPLETTVEPQSYDFTRLLNSKIKRTDGIDEFEVKLTRIIQEYGKWCVFQAEYAKNPNPNALKNLKTLIVHNQLTDVERDTYEHLQSQQIVIIEKKFEYGQYTMVLLEKGNRDLREALNDFKKNEAKIKNFLLDVCRHLSQLLENGYVHPEFKLEDIIEVNNRWKLSDIGITVRALKTKNQAQGPLQYLSKEVFQLEPFDYKADIWHLGHLLYELYTGKTLIQGNSNQELEDSLWGYDQDFYSLEVKKNLNQQNTRPSPNISINMQQPLPKLIQPNSLPQQIILQKPLNHQPIIEPATSHKGNTLPTPITPPRVNHQPPTPQLIGNPQQIPKLVQTSQSPLLGELIIQMIKLNPRERPSAKEIVRQLEHVPQLSGNPMGQQFRM